MLWGSSFPMRKSLLLLAIALAAFLLLAGCTTQPVRQGVDSRGVFYRGAENASLTIYEYSDFECPNCKITQPPLHDFLSEYQNKGVRLVYKYFPLEGVHPDARVSAVAAVCAAKQGKFWEMHDKLFDNQPRFSPDQLSRYAAEIGLDPIQFAACTKDPVSNSAVDADLADAMGRGLQGTPTFVVGDVTLFGAQSKERLSQAADLALAKK